jgi:hypothetical protein
LAHPLAKIAGEMHNQSDSEDIRVTDAGCKAELSPNGGLETHRKLKEVMRIRLSTGKSLVVLPVSPKLHKEH